MTDGTQLNHFGYKRYDHAHRGVTRHPRTTQERKANLDDFDGYRVATRYRKLRNSYDDILFERGVTRSWKWNRRTRWK